jgi:hypothetical protein
MDKEPENTWADRSARFPGDKRLRDHGFELVGRPKYGAARWRRRGGPILTEQAAHATISRELQQAAAANTRRGRKQ